MAIYKSDEKRNLYFCAYPYAFDKGCQIVTLEKGAKLYKVAELWAKGNGYSHVYVYNMNHDYIWDFKISEYK